MINSWISYSFTKILTLKFYIFLALFFSLITTIFTYLGFGVGDQIEQLPIILRELNPKYLQNDFFTNNTENSIARIYYVKLICLLANNQSNLPLIFVILTFLSNALISIITFFTGRFFFNQSNNAGILASALVMSVFTFDLGWQGTIYQIHFIPSSIAIPLIFLAIYFFSKQKILLSLVLCGLASFIHPLFGLESAALLLSTDVIHKCFQKKIFDKSNVKILIFSISIVLFFGMFSVLPQMRQPKIDDHTFINILAHFRHPHHYIPSTFALKAYVSAVIFLLVITWTLFTVKNNIHPFLKSKLSILLILIILSCIGGYLFVEIYPSRLWTTAQTFRLLYLVKWIGLIIVAGLISQVKNKSEAELYLSTLIVPYALILIPVFSVLKKQFNLLNNSLVQIVIVLAMSYLVTINISVFLFVFFTLILILTPQISKLKITIICTSVFFVLIFITKYNKSIPYLSNLNTLKSISNSFEPKIKLELDNNVLDIADYVKKNTDSNSIFLTPPEWGQFRLLSNRALVIDFKSFPFTDAAILDWQKRITDCYGKSKLDDLKVIENLTKNYLIINDKTLIDLQQKYQLSYVILRNETKSSNKIIYKNKAYKLIQLSN